SWRRRRSRSSRIRRRSACLARLPISSLTGETDTMDADLEYLLFIYALQNAVKHNSAPKSGAVIGTVLGKHPEFRSRVKEIGPLAGKVVAKVAAMDGPERTSLLEEIAPELLDELTETREHSRELPALL